MHGLGSVCLNLYRSRVSVISALLLILLLGRLLIICIHVCYHWRGNVVRRTLDKDIFDGWLLRILAKPTAQFFVHVLVLVYRSMLEDLVAHIANIVACIAVIDHLPTLVPANNASSIYIIIIG